MRTAVVLAAGNGDRFKNLNHHSKLLHPVGGRPLIIRTLETAAAAGIRSFCVVLGFEADRVRETILSDPIPGTAVDFVVNPDWHLENGVSALAARPRCPSRFALLMGDHLFDPAVLDRMLTLGVPGSDSILAVDSGPADPAVAAEATRVRITDGRITAIGKNINPWDALEEARRAGQTTLSAGVQRLAARGLMRAHDVAGAAWWDVDTVDDADVAESLVGAGQA